VSLDTTKSVYDRILSDIHIEHGIDDGNHNYDDSDAEPETDLEVYSSGICRSSSIIGLVLFYLEGCRKGNTTTIRLEIIVRGCSFDIGTNG